jgi:hypothetical protein
MCKYVGLGINFVNGLGKILHQSLYTIMTHLISPKITNRQRDFIIGTILGGSSIVRPPKGKNCYLSMRSRNLNWLRYKATELENLASEAPVTSEKTNRWHSMCYPIFNEFRDMFYEAEERKLTIEQLNPLRDIALSVWYLDCGKNIRGKTVMNTHVWGESGTQAIQEYFGCLGYNSEIFKERNNLRIRLNPDSSEEFMRLISGHFPAFLQTTSNQ